MTKSLWNGYERIDFLFENRECVLVFPNTPNENKNWLFKTEYFDAFVSFEIEMLNLGWHLAYIKNITRWCLDEDIHLKERFAKFICEKYSLSEKCVPVGMSCGGMIACKFAAAYPHRVKAMYLDAPVMNLLSCPAKVGGTPSEMFDEFRLATGMTLSELISYREHPLDKIPTIFNNDIPIVLVYGDNDDVVPYHENGMLLEKYYKSKGGNILAIGKKGCGHHPHGLEDNSPIIDFITKYGV